jgi:hypothetical protein
MPTPPGPLYQPVLVDRDDLPETFASSLRWWWADGVNITLEFIVNRPAEISDPDARVRIAPEAAAPQAPARPS